METHTKQNLIVGVIITSAIGLFSWRFYKTYKEVKKRQELDEEIEEQKELERIEKLEPSELRIEQLSEVHGYEAVKEAEELHVRQQELKEIRGHARDVQISILEEEEENGVFEEDEEEFEEEDFLYNEEEEELLKHHPDSEAAWNQYVNMRLADLDDPDILRIYKTLFKVDYYPIEDNRDHVLESNIYNHRLRFFGESSRFLGGGTFAEVLLHFAELLDFDLDEGIETWAERLLINLDFAPGLTLPYSKMEKTVRNVVNHRWYNPEMDNSFGIFGLFVVAETPELLEEMSFMEQYWRFIDDEV